MRKTSVSREIFAQYIINGYNQKESYIKAGGKDGAGVTQNASIFSRRPDVKRMINEGLQDVVLNSLVSLPALTADAIKKLSELVDSKDEKLALKASQIVLSKARDFLPKEININHLHEVSENDKLTEATEKLAEIAGRLQKQGANGEGAAGSILEAVRIGGSGVVQDPDEEHGDVSGECVFDVLPELETEGNT